MSPPRRARSSGHPTSHASPGPDSLRRVSEGPLGAVMRALDAIPGLEALPCDGEGHPIPEVSACVHARCTVASPEREELLARVAPVVRRARFVMAALVDRRDLYMLGLPPGRGQDVEEAGARLATLLGDASALDSGEVPDRRGR